MMFLIVPVALLTAASLIFIFLGRCKFLTTFNIMKKALMKRPGVDLIKLFGRDLKLFVQKNDAIQLTVEKSCYDNVIWAWFKLEHLSRQLMLYHLLLEKVSFKIIFIQVIAEKCCHKNFLYKVPQCCEIFGPLVELLSNKLDLKPETSFYYISCKYQTIV